MYCDKCGAKLSENEKFCTQCGRELEGSAPASQTENLVGFSDKINDPRVAEALAKMNKSAITFTWILALVFIFAFTLAGALEVGGLSLPSSVFYGLIIGLVLILISFFQARKGKKDGSWEGLIVDKKYKAASYSDDEAGGGRDSYTIIIRLENGRTKKLLSCKIKLNQ